MYQYQAAYLLEAIKEVFLKMQDSTESALKTNGLINNLSTFDVVTTLNLDQPEEINPILAVANNIITRGLPTIASLYIEESFATEYPFTQKIEDNGTIYFELKDEFQDGKFYSELYRSLHLIDPRLRERSHYINYSDLDSEFERSFLEKLIPEDYSFLAQLFEHQRSRYTLGADYGNNGRVDFCLEIPYYDSMIRTNRFNNQCEVKFNKRFIVEIDGSKYHEDFIDDLKDFEISRMPNNINHVRQNTELNDLSIFVDSIKQNDYIQTVKNIFNLEAGINKDIFSLVLSPVGIARIQKVIIQYFIANYGELIKRDNKLKIAIIERDVPCGFLAINDLVILLKNLNELAKKETILPNIEYKVYPCFDFTDSSRLNNSHLERLEDLRYDDYDIILDVSMLQRTGVVNDIVNNKAPNLIQIRSSYRVYPETCNTTYSSQLVDYKNVTKSLLNEQHQIISEVALTLKYFLNNIFRKIDFREGQLPILNRALCLKSVIGLLPTGGGKSLTYQLAAILQPGITVIVDPIKSLMVDQNNGLLKAGIDKSIFINSALSPAEKRYNQNKILATGQTQFVFVSPERFVIKEFRDALNAARNIGYAFTYVVIDEVHCVSEWGHDFRTPYLNLGTNAVEHCKTFDGRDITLVGLTATASFDVLADIERELLIPNEDGEFIVRYENTIRNEINYSIINLTTDNIDANINGRQLRENIGARKTKELEKILFNKHNILYQYDNNETYLDILRQAYDEFLPDNIKPEWNYYLDDSKRKLSLENGTFSQNFDREFTYGIIAFFPHRTGPLGVLTNFKYFNSNAIGEIDVFGYFVGSSDEDNGFHPINHDEESFKHLEAFLRNKESVMLATKAFGMGIDKSNIRFTVHANIPQSIESFVQESGRAGRDGKLSLSIMLYSNQKLPSSDYERTIDEDVLLFFHKNTFKGPIKEREDIYELRSNLKHPNISNLELIRRYINEIIANYSVEIKLNIQNQTIFVNDLCDDNIGYINLNKRSIRTNEYYGNHQLSESILRELFNKLPINLNPDETVHYLNSFIVDPIEREGVENKLNHLNDGESSEIYVSFTNLYYSKKTRSINQFNLNDNHKRYFEETFVQNGYDNVLDVQNVLIELRKSIFNSNTYQDFIFSLILPNDEWLNILLKDEKIERAYYKGRSNSDTAKAIYRMFSIGIIDSYTIDYQNKFYKVKFTKKKEQEYFDNLKNLFRRYTSQRTALNMTNKIIKEYHDNEEKKTVISVCLEHLTDFIYKKIADKRLQAIYDMVSLCEYSITIQNPIEQNRRIKEAIYYYFNAKYSRNKNIAVLQNDEETAASLPDDRESNLNTEETFWKYVNLVEIDKTGEFKNNIKHLRGSAMRMLRTYPDDVSYLLIKSYSLFILSDDIPFLIKEASSEFVKAMSIWKAQDDDVNFITMVSNFKDKVTSHIANDEFETVFSEIEDSLYSKYYLDWLKKFNESFITKE